MQNMNFFIKPASGHCNMRCRCCYEDETSAREGGNTGIMSLDTADKLITEAFVSLSDQGGITFDFQGGAHIGGSSLFQALCLSSSKGQRQWSAGKLCNSDQRPRPDRKLGAGYLQFIPCLDPLEVERGSMPYSLTPELYGDFLCALFDEWYRDFSAGKYTSIRLFDNYVHLAMGLPAGTCSTAGTCGAYFVVEGDGTLYPCDFYCLDDWKLGKLGEVPLPDLAAGKVAQQFLADGLEHPAECKTCPWVRLCNGGCKRDWVRVKEGNHNYFCPSFRKFFDYAAPGFLKLPAPSGSTDFLCNRKMGIPHDTLAKACHQHRFDPLGQPS